MPKKFISEEMCKIAVSHFGMTLEFVPEEFKTKEIFFTAVRKNGKALRYADISKLTKEEYHELCNIALHAVNKNEW